MLTDYHVHLRRDGPEHLAEEAFTPANAERYQEVASERGIDTLGVSGHIHRFRQALDVWRHPFPRGARGRPPPVRGAGRPRRPGRLLRFRPQEDEPLARPRSRLRAWDR